MQRSPLPSSLVVLAILSPLPAVAVAGALDWPWWAAALAGAVVIAVVAEVAGIHAGVLSALLATSGVALVVERTHPHHLPRNGVELVAMAGLLVVALIFGVNRPVD